MENLIEITRSYARKINKGNYESADYFCSAKEQTEKDKAEETSYRLHQFCRDEVLRMIAEDAKLEKLNYQPKPNTFASGQPSFKGQNPPTLES